MNKQANLISLYAMNEYTLDVLDAPRNCYKVVVPEKSRHFSLGGNKNRQQPCNVRRIPPTIV